MKHYKIVSKFFLSALLFSGCTDKIDMEFPAREPNYQGTINLSVVALNPTEQRLRGEWYLRSMSTPDSVFSDSIVNRSKKIGFSEFAFAGETHPIFQDFMGLYARLLPDSSVYTARTETWYAPDSSTLKINFKEFNRPEGTVSFEIANLALYQLTLVDNSTGRKWNFER